MLDRLSIFGFLIAFGSFLVSTVLTGVIKKIAFRLGAIDKPGERRSHTTPTPRGGGIAVVITYYLFITPLLIFRIDIDKTMLGLLITGLGIAVLGTVDDLITLSRNFRIIAWVLISVVAVAFGLTVRQIILPVIGVIEFGFFSPIVTFLWLIGVTNFFNFMDGIDGLAASEAVIVSGFLLVFSLQAGNALAFFSSLILFGGSAGFLVFNFPPAKIFMGDGGSNFLGFIFAALAIIGEQKGDGRIPFLVLVILLGMFLLDAGVTLIKRVPRGRNWLEPHRDHYYQRLIKLGYSHKKVTMLYSAMSVVLGLVATFYLNSSGIIQGGVFLLVIMPFIVVVTLTHFLENRNTSISE